MKWLGFHLLLVMLFLLVACDGGESGKGTEVLAFSEDENYPGMLRVNATGRFAVLGTNVESAKAIEKPEMTVKFDYDFSLGRHEVTCGEFNDVMASKKSGTSLQLECENPELPAVNVSFFDAVLYANAMSKKYKLDTAYTYRSLSFDAAGRCTLMDGFSFLSEADGFRLPTEAEWVLVAGARWNPEKSWNALNSDFTSHEVCTSEAESDGDERKFCDIAGNVMEWVNDYLGPFHDTTVTNSVGFAGGSGVGERILKGGSFRNEPANMNLYNRGDVYSVNSATYAGYVGFRLALGKVPDALWMNASGQTCNSRLFTLASSSEIRKVLGTYQVRLVFRNDLSGNLVYLNYKNGVLEAEEIPDTLDVYHPEISPDGKRVAFSTGQEGLGGPSAIYVRPLDKPNAHAVKLDVESAAIPRWRVLPNGDTVIVYVTSAGVNSNEADFIAQSTWQVPFAKDKFGKPEKLFEGAYHGGVSTDDRLAVTGARLLRARVDGKTEIWYDEEQACNASLDQDGSKRTLFLDFGGKGGRKFTKTDYRTHEMLLVADSTGKLLQGIPSPEGFSFDHSEWTILGGSREELQNDFVVATLANANGAHTKIVLVNVKDSTVVDLMEGEELWHPSLWRLPPAQVDDDDLDLDSAGVYLGPNHVPEQAFLRAKMECFWKNLGKTEVALVGSSRMEMGVNPDLFPEWNMLNFGVSGIDPNRDQYFINNYILNYPDRLFAIVFSIDLDSWRGIERHLELDIYSVPGFLYDANHGFWVDGMPSGFLTAVEEAFPADKYIVDMLSERGGEVNAARGWNSESVEVMNDSVFTEAEVAFMDSTFQKMEAIIHRANDLGIEVVGIIFPLAPQYKETGSFGTYGLQRSEAKKRIAYLDSLAKHEPNFHLMDENKMGEHDYGENMAVNRDHLSIDGANQLTTRLDSLLKTLKSK